MSAAKAKNTEIVAETVIETAETPEMQFIEIPAKICVQIGMRKRYFSTREDALAALTEFNDRGKAKAAGPHRTGMTAEQRAQRAANRAVLMQYAELQGKAGKNIAMLANTLEDLIAQVPAVLALIAEYNTTPRTEGEAVETTSTTEQSETAVQAGDAVDPLADFGI